MPGPRNVPSKPSRLMKSARPPASLPGSPAPTEAAAAAAAVIEQKNVALKWPNTVRVRVICTDPDATDSSSDDDSSRGDSSTPPPVRSRKRRIIREVLLPASLEMPPSCNSCVQKCADVPEAPAKKASSTAGKPFKGAYRVMKGMQCGKWAAKIHNAVPNGRQLLGVYGSPEAALQVNDNSAPHVNDLQVSANHATDDQSSGQGSKEETCTSLESPDATNSNPASLSESFDYASSGFWLGSESAEDNGFSDIVSNERTEGSNSEMADDAAETKSGALLKSTVVPLNTELSQEITASLDLCMVSGFSTGSFVPSDSRTEEFGKILEDDLESFGTVNLSMDLGTNTFDTDADFELDSEALGWIEMFGAGL